MKKIKIKTPAKINLTLEVLNKRQDGFHNIQSIMQTISLYDILTFELSESNFLSINLSGNSGEIPYNSNNLVYKAANVFFERLKISNCKLSVFIEKHIPVSAGLAGGSTNAAGTLLALNKVFNNPFGDFELNELCSKLGSDLNFCLKGGCALCTSRGEIIEPLPAYIQKVSLIKPKNLGISAKEAYTKFSLLENKVNPDNTHKLKNLLIKGEFNNSLLYNSLEKALLQDYPQLQKIKCNVKNSLMTGSGSAFFVLEDKIKNFSDENNYMIYENLITTKSGIIFED